MRPAGVPFARAAALLAWGAVAAGVCAAGAAETPDEVFPERLYQAAPVISADSERGTFSVVGHAQDRLAMRSLKYRGAGAERGPIRSVTSWPLRFFDSSAVATEPVAGRTLVVWSQETRALGVSQLLAQGFSSRGRRLGPELELEASHTLGEIRVVYVPWERAWLVAWFQRGRMAFRTVRPNGREMGQLRVVEAAPPAGGGFDLAVDPRRRRILIAGYGGATPAPRRPGRLKVWFVDLEGRQVAQEVSLGRYNEGPILEYDPRRGRFLVVWRQGARIRGRFLEGRRPSRRFVLHRDFPAFVELAFSPREERFLLTWVDGRVVLPGVESGAVLFARWLDADARRAGKDQVIAILPFFQDLDVDYTACVEAGCLVTWEASRGLSDGTFIKRNAIVSRFLPAAD